MYKILHNEILIDVVDNITYLRYLPRSRKLVKSDESTANCIRSSDGSEVYAIQGRMPPVLHDFKVVSIEELNSDNELVKYNLEHVSALQTRLTSSREKKIEEFREQCKQAIVYGVTVNVDEEQLHFELTTEDQLNLNRIKTKLLSGADAALYHAKGQPCRMFSKSQLTHIIQSVEAHIDYHTTYFNLWKHCINNMYNISAIDNLHYGESLPISQQKMLDIVTKR